VYVDRHVDFGDTRKHEHRIAFDECGAGGGTKWSVLSSCQAGAGLWEEKSDHSHDPPVWWDLLTRKCDVYPARSKR
jgi:hypothetical protein